MDKNFEELELRAYENDAGLAPHLDLTDYGVRTNFNAIKSIASFAFRRPTIKRTTPGSRSSK